MNITCSFRWLNPEPEPLVFWVYNSCNLRSGRVQNAEIAWLSGSPPETARQFLVTSLDGNCLTPIQVSVKTGIPKRTLARWRTDGKGPRFVKRGGRILYAAKDLEAWQVDEASKQAAARAWGLL